MMGSSSNSTGSTWQGPIYSICMNLFQLYIYDVSLEAFAPETTTSTKRNHIYIVPKQ